jgi:hypothetical protein
MKSGWVLGSGSGFWVLDLGSGVIDTRLSTLACIWDMANKDDNRSSYILALLHLVGK